MEGGVTTRLARDFELNRLTEWLWRGILAWICFTVLQNARAIERIQTDHLMIMDFVAEQRQMNRSQVQINATLTEISAGFRRDIVELNEDIDQIRGR